jgi:hypothetical protein
VHRNVVGPGLGVGHVGDVDVAALELTRCRIDEPVLLPLLVDGLRIENHHPQAAWRRLLHETLCG